MPERSSTPSRSTRVPTDATQPNAVDSTEPRENDVRSVARVTGDDEWNVTTALDTLAEPSRRALHKFFYPVRRNRPSSAATIPRDGLVRDEQQQQQPHDEFAARRHTTRQRMTTTDRLEQHEPSVLPAPTNRQPSSVSSVNATAAASAHPEGVNGTTHRANSNAASNPPTDSHNSGASAASSVASSVPNVQEQFNQHFSQQEDDDRLFVHHFWRTYDDIIILSLFTQIGMVFRLAMSTWLAIFDGVFSNDSALFVNLPLNCLACFFMGILCSGERLMEIIVTRFSPPRLQQALQAAHRHRVDSDDEADDHEHDLEAEDAVNSSTYENGSVDADGSIVASPDGASRGSATLRRRKRRRRRKTQKGVYFHSWEPPSTLNNDLRDVQLLALERRIRQSKCLVLFPVKQEDVDVMEHYFDDGYKRKPHSYDDDEEDCGENGGRDLNFDLALEVERNDPPGNESRRSDPLSPTLSVNMNPAALPVSPLSTKHESPRALPRNLPAGSFRTLDSVRRVDLHSGPLATPPSRKSRPAAAETEEDMAEVDLEAVPARTRAESSVANDNDDDDTTVRHSDEPQEQQQTDLNRIVHDVSANVTENISRLQRVNLADGWDVGTSPEDMSDDLMLGLRGGFCGALSSFSSWNSAMVSLLKNGNVGTAFVGYMLGIQLPIVAYRFGQHVAVYIFIWRARHEKRKDERRGYGIRVSLNEYSERGNTDDESLQTNPNDSSRETPSIRAVVTAIFIMGLVTQCTSMSFFNDPDNQQIALSLLFSPLGVLGRWRLSKYNTWSSNFPIGTFTANILACALSGGLGNLLAGEPGPAERIILVSFINGFAGSLSSLASFIVEILAGVDPVLFRFDGMIYAVLSIFWALVVGFIFSASVDWADVTESSDT
jgi:fluoride ion exporter CrcB/FEX